MRDPAGTGVHPELAVLARAAAPPRRVLRHRDGLSRRAGAAPAGDQPPHRVLSVDRVRRHARRGVQRAARADRCSTGCWSIRWPSWPPACCARGWAEIAAAYRAISACRWPCCLLVLLQARWRPPGPARARRGRCAAPAGADRRCCSTASRRDRCASGSASRRCSRPPCSPASRTRSGPRPQLLRRLHRSSTILRAYHFLVHGTTVHGAQHTDPAAGAEPLTYFHRAGPLGQVFARSRSAGPRDVGAVGLGVGTVACYRTAGPALDLLRDRPAGRADRPRSALLPLSRRLRARCRGGAGRCPPLAAGGADRALRSPHPRRLQLRCDPGASPDARGRLRSISTSWRRAG